MGQEGVGRACPVCVPVATLLLCAAPSLEVGEQYLDVSAGAPTLVYVNAEGSPTPLVLWKQGEEYLDEERYPVLSGGSLYIPETLPTHQGTYTVSATNANGTVNADVRIDVYQQTPPPRCEGSLEGDKMECCVTPPLPLPCSGRECSIIGWFSRVCGSAEG